ncbi:MAG: 4-hydroxybutyrate CoA-transferase [Deltaproteobacteria bacterium]|nr:4-hydroxybutyrate CoA-transferase [Candidatus Zymogenaceae bacterium]
MDWQETYKKKLVTADQAAALVKSGDNISMPGGPSQPIDIVNAICKRKDELKDVIFTSGLSMYPYDLFKAEYKGHIGFYSIFLGPMERAFAKEGNVEQMSYHFSLGDHIVRKIQSNIYMIEVSSPDDYGYMSFGPIGVYNGDIGTRYAKTVIVQVNKETPRVLGRQAFIHVDDVTCIVENDHPIAEIPEMPISDEERKIGELIAERIPDGATIQCGLGAVSDAVVNMLDSKKDLGVHTEMFTNGMYKMALKGVINGRRKNFHTGKHLCAFSVGSRDLYKYLDNNPMFEFAPITYVNSPFTVYKNDNMVAINNILTADLTGQCASESIGHVQYSGTGGQADYVRGANASKGGMNFLATASTAQTKSGKVSKIVCNFKPGTVITTPRSDIQYIVTEYGVANLWLESIPKRVSEMIKIAHPEFREDLKREAKEAGLI